MTKIFYLIMEGDRDETFFKEIIIPLLTGIKFQFQIWKFATKSPDKRYKFINFLKNTNKNYIVIADFDNCICLTEKKELLKSIGFKKVSDDQFIIVKTEIESWYLAGIDQEKAKLLNLKIPQKTENITKEQFINIIPERHKNILKSRDGKDQIDISKDFLIEILKHYNVETAQNKNQSFKYFIEKFNKFIENQ